MTVNPVKQAIVRACTDAAYRARLLADPQQALAEEGLEIPPGVEVRVHESTDEKLLVVLPGPQAVAIQERTQQLPTGPVADVPAGLTLSWQGHELIATGRLDTSTAPALRRELQRAFTDVDLVLTGVTFLSSAGLAALLAAQKHLAAHDCHLRLSDVPQELRNVLEMVGFLDLFEIVDRRSMDEAYVASWGAYMHPW
jgi:anti-anti-sigma factor